MKVCKVVINSVTHDARVLKEAEAVRKAGFDVVIVGIQDANVNVPIQLLEDGTVIRRVAWQSTAFRPSSWVFIGQTAALLALVAGAVVFAAWLVRHYADVLKRLTYEHVLILAGALVAICAGRLIWNNYQRRRRAYATMARQEETGLLKYDQEFSSYRASLPVLATESGTEGVDVSGQSQAPATARFPALERLLRSLARIKRETTPRPLLGGLRQKTFTSANFKRWKTIFARERQIYNVLAEQSPGVVHAHDLNSLPIAVKYAKAHGAKLVFDAHEIYDHLAQSEDDLSELNSALLKKYSGNVDLFITINDSIARYYRKAYPRLPEALVVKNATKRAGDMTYDGCLHEAAGVPRATRILIYQGGFAPKRGLIPLLLSAEHLDPRWCLVFMGWGKLEEEMRRIADSLKMKNPDLDQRIRFVPKVKQTELPHWTCGASLGAIPYENTGLNHWYCNPNKLWEYPNAGVPIIASPFPELRKTIQDNQIGWMLPDPLHPRDIAAVVNKLTDEDLAVASQNCKDFIQRDNWDIYAARLTATYQRWR